MFQKDLEMPAWKPVAECALQRKCCAQIRQEVKNSFKPISIQSFVHFASEASCWNLCHHVSADSKIPLFAWLFAENLLLFLSFPHPLGASPCLGFSPLGLSSSILHTVSEGKVLATLVALHSSVTPHP